jgi:hypothetical protein
LKQPHSDLPLKRTELFIEDGNVDWGGVGRGERNILNMFSFRLKEATAKLSESLQNKRKVLLFEREKKSGRKYSRHLEREFIFPFI